MSIVDDIAKRTPVIDTGCPSPAINAGHCDINLASDCFCGKYMGGEPKPDYVTRTRKIGCVLAIASLLMRITTSNKFFPAKW